MRSLPTVPVFTFDQARELGWTSSALKHATKVGRVSRVRKGVYARADVSSVEAEDRAVPLSCADAVASNTSAARLRGYPLVGLFGERAEVTVPPHTNADIPGAHPYRATLRDHDVDVLDGIPVTSPARTAIDIARHQTLLTAVVVVDHVLHEGLATPEELVDAFDFCREWPGAAAARRVLLRCDSRAESPLESLSRLVIAKLKLPVPQPQVRIFDLDGRFVGRTDFYWDDFGVAGEADGHGKYVDREVLVTEKGRQEELEDTNLEVTRWNWSKAWSDHPAMSRRLRNAFARGVARDRAHQVRGWVAVPTPRLVVLA